MTDKIPQCPHCGQQTEVGHDYMDQWLAMYDAEGTDWDVLATPICALRADKAAIRWAHLYIDEQPLADYDGETIVVVVKPAEGDDGEAQVFAVDIMKTYAVTARRWNGRRYA